MVNNLRAIKVTIKIKFFSMRFQEMCTLITITFKRDIYSHRQKYLLLSGKRVVRWLQGSSKLTKAGRGRAKRLRKERHRCLARPIWRSWCLDLSEIRQIRPIWLWIMTPPQSRRSSCSIDCSIWMGSKLPLSCHRHPARQIPPSVQNYHNLKPAPADQYADAMSRQPWVKSSWVREPSEFPAKRSPHPE